MARRRQNPDLSRLLAEWPYVSGQVQSRLIQSEDGLPRIQIRLELGIIQMHYSGRPDGATPNGFSSLLEFHELQRDSAAAADDDPGSLIPDDANALRHEIMSVYHRAVALLAIGDFVAVLRDVAWAERATDLLTYATDSTEEDAAEALRPHYVSLRARAVAAAAIRDDLPDLAAAAIDTAIASLQTYVDRRSGRTRQEAAAELGSLKTLRDRLSPEPPVTQAGELRARLAKALEQENYRLAAILRDELRQLKAWP